MANALKAVRDFNLKAGQKCVVILPDSVRNYMYEKLLLIICGFGPI